MVVSPAPSSRPPAPPSTPNRQAGLDRASLEHERDRTFSFDEFGPLAIKPDGWSCWAEESRPQRLRANYNMPGAFLDGGEMM